MNHWARLGHRGEFPALGHQALPGAAHRPHDAHQEGPNTRPHRAHATVSDVPKAGCGGIPPSQDRAKDPSLAVNCQVPRQVTAHASVGGGQPGRQHLLQ